jgi:outer membrane immunogenic protein
MRRLALLVVASVGVGVGSAAFAADMPLPGVPPPAVPYLPVVPPFSWTGFYLGGNLGLGWSQGSFSDPAGNSLGLPNNARLLGGGQVGFNFEYYGGFVIGAEADFDWFADSNTNTSNPVPLFDTFGNPTGSTATIAIDNKWLTTVTGRLGYAFDRVLLYGKGGGAWVGSNNPTVAINGAPAAINVTSNNWGWTAGVGVEWTVLGQPLRADRVRLCRAEQPELHAADGSRDAPGRRSIRGRQQPLHPVGQCRRQLPLRRLVTV